MKTKVSAQRWGLGTSLPYNYGNMGNSDWLPCQLHVANSYHIIVEPVEVTELWMALVDNHLSLL